MTDRMHAIAAAIGRGGGDNCGNLTVRVRVFGSFTSLIFRHRRSTLRAGVRACVRMFAAYVVDGKTTRRRIARRTHRVIHPEPSQPMNYD